jgi:SAM-dependent methyltransferase
MRMPVKIFARFRRSSRSNANDDSANYEILAQETSDDLDGWRSVSVSERQHQSFAPLIENARQGRPRVDFIVAARALDATGLKFPLVVEVGCGSAYYSEVLPLLAQPIRYIGIDYAFSMTSLAHREYPTIPLVTADACRLPLADECCDVVMSGTSLMHIPKYTEAIAETVRVAREWCIFHTVPVMAQRETTLLRKHAYGRPVVEVIFNQSELEAEFAANGLETRSVFESLPYDVSQITGEPSWTLTYVCRKR